MGESAREAIADPFWRQDTYLLLHLGNECVNILAEIADVKSEDSAGGARICLRVVPFSPEERRRIGKFATGEWACNARAVNH
jgi:hypothetical protein